MISIKKMMPLLPLAALLALGAISSTNAFCVYNDSPHTVGVIQLPITQESYKKNVDADSKDCCNWQDCQGDQAGRCGHSTFCLVAGGIDNIDVLYPQDAQRLCGSQVQSFNGGVVYIDGNGDFHGFWDSNNPTPPPGTC